MRRSNRSCRPSLVQAENDKAGDFEALAIEGDAFAIIEAARELGPVARRRAIRSWRY